MRDKDVEDILEHFGIPGMHWGIKNERLPGVDRSTHIDAHKDAKEFARAKQFTGVGAGNRRKHINSTVASKKMHSTGYSKTFDMALAGQDVSKHVEKAKAERKRKDASYKTKKTVGAVARRVTGEPGTQAALVGVAIAGAAYLKTPHGQAKTRQAVRVVKNAANSNSARQGRAFVQSLLR